MRNPLSELLVPSSKASRLCHGEFRALHLDLDLKRHYSVHRTLSKRISL